MEMRVAVIVENEPQIANLAIAAFGRFGVDAFAIETVEEAVEVLERSKNIAALLLNLTNDPDELVLVKTVARRWPSIKIVLMSDCQDHLRNLPPLIFVAKPTTTIALIGIIEWVARAVASDRDPAGD